MYIKFSLEGISTIVYEVQFKSNRKRNKFISIHCYSHECINEISIFKSVYYYHLGIGYTTETLRRVIDTNNRVFFNPYKTYYCFLKDNLEYNDIETKKRIDTHIEHAKINREYYLGRKEE